MKKIIAPLALLALTFALRLPGLKSFVAVDEPAWLTRGANFYYALGQREFEHTISEYHPSVPTMWYVAAATWMEFPEFRGLGQGYFDFDKETFDPFLRAHGKDPLQILFLARIMQIAVISLTILAVYELLKKMMSAEQAFFASAFISTSPYFLGHSRILSHEGMTAIFVGASLLALMVYLEWERKWYFLATSAAFAALAQLTKSSAIAMTPAVGLMFVWAVFARAKADGFFRALFSHLKVFAAWLALLALTYVLAWPAMWVAPDKALYEVYGNAFSYAFQGGRLEVTQELQPAQFQLASAGGAAWSFVAQIFQRSSLWAWLGAAWSVLFLFGRGENAYKKIFLYFSVTAAAFILLFSAAQGRNSAHYVMTSHVNVNLLAALGWLQALRWLGSTWKPAARWKTAALILILLAQTAETLPYFPYFYNYSNPLTRPALSDYGEGFEQAAAYLAAKPNADELTTFSYRGRGAFSYFFPGKTLLVNPLFFDEPRMDSVSERLRQSDYLVINDAFTKRSPRIAAFAAALNQFSAPEKDLRAKNAYVIHIYYVKDLPPEFYKAIESIAP
ncbi:MAG: hypothetical protein Fur002_12940 [Anaerolineales bacterium]